MMKLRRSDKILEDLINLSARIAEHDLAAADDFLDAVAESFERLTQMPFVGVERSFTDTRLSGIRMWFVKGYDKHLIFYRVIDDTIEIIRVLHSARDIENALADDDDERPAS
jgi:toxin ParE1/3/4